MDDIQMAGRMIRLAISLAILALVLEYIVAPTLMDGLRQRREARRRKAQLQSWGISDGKED